MKLTDADIDDMNQALDTAEPEHLGFVPDVDPKTEGDPVVAEKIPLPTQPPLPKTIGPRSWAQRLTVCTPEKDERQKPKAKKHKAPPVTAPSRPPWVSPFEFGPGV